MSALPCVIEDIKQESIPVGWKPPACQLDVLHYRLQTKFAKTMVSQVSVCPRVGGAAWYRGVHGRGVCISPARMLPRQILGDTVNELAVRILLECILVMNKFEHEGGSLLVYNEVPYLGGRARGQYTVRSHVCGIGY